MIPLAQINPAPYNPRKPYGPGDPAFEKVKRSIEEFGVVEPLVWNRRTGHLVGGHLRLRVYAARGDKTVPCTIVDLEAEREMALNIALNKVGGDWDDVLLSELIQSLQNYGTDLTLTGFDERELFDMLRLADSVHATDFLDPLLSAERPGDGRDDDDAHGNPPDPDAPGEELLSDAPNVNYVTLNYVVTPEQRSVVVKALNGARETYGVSTAAEALVEICRDITGG